MRRQKSASCFGEGGPFAIEIGLCYLIFGQLFTAQGLSELPQFGHSFLQFLYGVVTFEHGFMTTIGMMLFLYQIANYGKHIFPYSLTHSKHTHTHTLFRYGLYQNLFLLGQSFVSISRTTRLWSDSHIVLSVRFTLCSCLGGVKKGCR